MTAFELEVEEVVVERLLQQKEQMKVLAFPTSQPSSWSPAYLCIPCDSSSMPLLDICV